MTMKSTANSAICASLLLLVTAELAPPPGSTLRLATHSDTATKLSKFGARFIKSFRREKKIMAGKILCLSEFLTKHEKVFKNACFFLNFINLNKLHLFTLLSNYVKSTIYFFYF